MKNEHRNHTLHVYILREYAFSFVISFLFFFFIFFINQILLVARNILLKNVSALDMFLILLYSIPIILSYSIPFASMTGATMALGDLSSRNEIQAMRTSGISYRSIITPIVIFSMVLTGMSFVLNDVFLPLGTIRYKALYRELLYENPGLDLESYSVARFNDLIFVNGQVNDNSIENLLIIDTGQKEVDMISSKVASLSSDDDQQLISLSLSSVQSLSPKGSGALDYDYAVAERMDYFLQLKDISFNLMSVAPNEKSLRDLNTDLRLKRQEVREQQETLDTSIEELGYSIISNYRLDAYDLARRDYRSSYQQLLDRRETSLFSKTLQYYLLEFYKKTALPFACFFLVFFAMPFSLIPMKNGRLVGFTVGIITSVAYWFMLFAGQTLGTRITLHPFLIMWAPNLLLFSFGIIFLSRRMRT